MIPEGWRLVKLGDSSIGVTSSGGTPSRSVQKYFGGDIPWVKSGELNDGLILKTEEKISEAGLSSSSAKVFPQGTLLMAMYGATVGKTALLGRDAATNQAVCAITPVKNSFLPEYMQSLLVSYRDRILQARSGAAQPNISQEIICNLDVLLPPLPEQKAIAAILSTWDRAAEQATKLIEAKTRLKKGLMQQLLTGKKRFRQYQTTKWRTLTIDDISRVRRGASPRPIGDAAYFADEGPGWVRIVDVTKGGKYLRTTEQKLSPLGVARSVGVKPGDLIMSICGSIGVPSIVDMNACIHDGFVLFADLRGEVDTEFLYYYLSLKTEEFQSQGQPGTQKNLNTTIVGTTELHLPSLSEQKQIAGTLDCADNEVRVLERKLRAFQMQKQALMQILLTGKVRVKLDSASNDKEKASKGGKR